MKALLATAGGPLETARVGDVPTPVAGPGQVLIEVEAASLNAVDRKQADGTLEPFRAPPVLGFDVAGRVIGLGGGMSRFELGDRVLASTMAAGSIAEYTLADDDDRIARWPAGLGTDAAAALPSAALSAAEMLRQAGIDGGTALIIGASGGVGTFLVQLAAAAGARVIATGHAGDEQELRRLGADSVIDYRDADLATEALRLTGGRGVEAVLDVVSGPDEMARIGRAVAPGGSFVTALDGRSPLRSDLPVRTILVRPRPGELEDLAARAASRALQVVVSEAVSLEDAAAALLRMRDRHTIGKIVIRVA